MHLWRDSWGRTRVLSKRRSILMERRTRAKNSPVKQEGLKLDCRRHFLTRKMSPRRGSLSKEAMGNGGPVQGETQCCLGVEVGLDDPVHFPQAQVTLFPLVRGGVTRTPFTPCCLPCGPSLPASLVLLGHPDLGPPPPTVCSPGPCGGFHGLRVSMATILEESSPSSGP